MIGLDKITHLVYSIYTVNMKLRKGGYMKALVKIDSKSIQTKQTSMYSLIEAFIGAQDIKAKSKDTYRKALKSFFLFLNGNSQNITREKILAYKQELISRGLSPYTVSGYLTAVKKLFEYAESLKLYPNIAKGIKGAKKPKGFSKDALTVEQVKKILRDIDRSSLQGKRDFAILNLLVRTGLRTIEIVRANVEDIRQEGGEALLYIQGKGRDNKDNFVLLTEETLKPIRAYLAERKQVDDKEPLFCSISDRNNNERLSTRSISRIAKANFILAGLNSKRISAHSLRHTAVTLSLLGGATLQEAQALARHSDINTTQIYAHNIERVGKAPERKIDEMLKEVNSVNLVN